MADETQVPTMADYFTSQDSGKTPAQVAQERIAANPPVAPEAAPAAQQQAAPASVDPPAAPPATESTAFDYKRFDVENDAQLVVKWGNTSRERDEFKKQYEEVNGRFEQVKPILEVADYLKNPFADTLTHKVNNFIQKSGIKDDGKGSAHRFAIEVLTTDEEKIKSDPIQAIALAKALDNPALAAAGMDKIYRATAIELGLDLNDRENWTSDQNTILEIKSIDALKTISEKKSAYDIEDDFFVGLQRQHATNAERSRQAEEQWSKITPAIVSEITKLASEVEIEGIGKVGAEIALSETEVRTILERMKPTLQRINPDEQGRAQVKEILVTALRSANFEKLYAEGIKKYHNDHKATVEQEIRRQQVNGGPIVKEQPKLRKPGEMSAFEQELERIRPK